MSAANDEELLAKIIFEKRLGKWRATRLEKK
jgi:hypothetical protein